MAACLLDDGPPPRDLLADKGFNGAAFAAEQAARGAAVPVPPTKKQRAGMPKILQKIIAEWRNRVEATFGEITDRMELARHGAHTFWGNSCQNGFSSIGGASTIQTSFRMSTDPPFGRGSAATRTGSQRSRNGCRPTRRQPEDQALDRCTQAKAAHLAELLPGGTSGERKFRPLHSLP